jgi:molybdopterin biosynthesis enzyme
MVRGVLRFQGGHWQFCPNAGQGSADMTSLLGINALARVPVGVGHMEAGQVVQVERLPV